MRSDVIENEVMFEIERMVDNEIVLVPWFDNWTTEWPHLWELIDERLRELHLEWKLDDEEIDPTLVAFTVIKRKWYSYPQETLET